MGSVWLRTSKLTMHELEGMTDLKFEIELYMLQNCICYRIVMKLVSYDDVAIRVCIYSYIL